jgi:hypothetical protein
MNPDLVTKSDCGIDGSGFSPATDRRLGAGGSPGRWGGVGTQII